MSHTPFPPANPDIDQNELNITSRLLSSLSAASTKPVSALIDRRAVGLDNTDPLNFKIVSSIVNNYAAPALSITSLSNTSTVTITAMDNQASQKTAAVTKIGSGPSAKSQATVTTPASGHGLQQGDSIAASGASCSAAFTTASVTITYVSATVFTYTL